LKTIFLVRLIFVIVAKILAHRLKKRLGKIIDQNKETFLKRAV